MIAYARATVAADLGDNLGLPVHTTMPDRPHAPLCYLTEADPFITPEDGGPYGSWVAHFRAAVVIEPGNNAAMIADADAYATRLLDLTARHDVTVRGYQTDTYAGSAYLIVPADITTRLTTPPDQEISL